MIPLTVPALGDDEMRAVERVLRSGMLVQGKEVLAFEAALAAETTRKHAVALANGTAALELALRALGVGPGDEVLCPALTWPSPAHAVLSLGAVPVLVDVDAHEWNATEQHFAEALSARTRAAIVIEQFGNPARHERIEALLGAVPVLVDAACSLGSSYRGAPCGSHGVISCSSFHPRKVITTGEPGRFVSAAGNQRLTEFQAAMGSVQMQKLHAMCSVRKRLAQRYEAGLPGFRFQRAPEGGEHNRQTLAVLVGPEGEGPGVRDRLIPALLEQGVQAGRLSYALAELPQFASARAEAERAGRSLANARDIAERGLALPLYFSMTESDVDRVVTALTHVLSR
jgi:perosamine synthetase